MLRPRPMLRPLAITTLVIAGFYGVAQADVYRWVDDKGEAHFSDRWVPGSELLKSSKPRPFGQESSSPVAAPAASQPKAAAPNQNPAAAKAAEQAIKQDVAKTKEAQCKQAKERYQKAIEARRLFKPPKNGDTDRVYMSDAETDAYRLQARNDVTLACGSPPAAVEPQ